MLTTLVQEVSNNQGILTTDTLLSAMMRMEIGLAPYTELVTVENVTALFTATRDEVIKTMNELIEQGYVEPRKDVMTRETSTVTVVVGYALTEKARTSPLYRESIYSGIKDIHTKLSKQTTPTKRAATYGMSSSAASALRAYGQTSFDKTKAWHSGK